MNRQQKLAFREFVRQWVRRLERAMKVGQRSPGDYTQRMAAHAAGE